MSENGKEKSPRSQVPGRGAKIRFVERGVAFLLALVLLRSSFAHVGNPYYFLSDVYAYKILGLDLGFWWSMVLPFMQMGFAASLILKYALSESYLLVTMLFLSFFAVQVATIIRGLEISCGCFGASSSLMVGWTSSSVALGLAGMAGLGFLLARRLKRGPS